MAQELQTQAWDEGQLRQTLEPALRRLTGPATLGDIVTRTGLPAERTEPVLRRVLDEYRGRLAVDERGELIYSFPHGLQRATTWRELWQQARAAAWEWFKLAFKVGISVMLVVYFVVFLVILVAAVVAMLAGLKDVEFDGCGDGLGDGCGDGFGNGCAQLFFWYTPPVMPAPRRQRSAAWGQRRMTPFAAKPNATPQAPFWRQVYEFVFGPEAPPHDPLAAERELLAYVRDHGGRLTAAEIAALRGVSLDEAERIALHLNVAHGGDVEVSNDGTILYTYDRLMVSAEPEAQGTGRRWSWWWERPEAPARLNHNTPGRNWGIGLLNGFNLAFSALLLAGGLQLGSWVGLLLGVVPCAFSALLFLIPGVRRLRLTAENRERARRNLLRELSATVWTQAGTATEDALVVEADPAAADSPAAGHSASPLERLAQWWEGEPDADDAGRVGYRFGRLRTELADVAAARAALAPDQFRLGPIAYDSEGGESGGDGS